MLSRLARLLTDRATDHGKASSKNIFNEETTKQVGERIGQTLAKHLEDNNITGEGAVQDFKDYTEKVIDYNIGTSVSNRTLLETDEAFDKKLEPFMEGEARQLSDLNQLSLLDPDSEFRSKLGESIEPLRRTLEDFDTPDIEMEDELDENLNKFNKTYPTSTGEELDNLALQVDNTLREKQRKKFQKIKGKLYRAFKVGTETDSDLRFFNPSEVGVHLGTSGQADAIIRKKTLVDKGDYSREDLAKYIIQNNGSENTVINPIDTTSHLNFKKAEYYVSLENPLVFPYQEPGEWSADRILTDGYSLENFDKALKINLKSEAPYSPEQMKTLKELVQQANEINYYKARFLNNEVSNPLLDPDKPKRGMAKYKMVDMVARWNLNLEFQEWIRSFGFDSIKYVNDIEPSYATDVDHLVDIAQVEKEFNPDALQRKRNLVDFDEPRHWSYIAFKPEQLKTTDAVAFDPEDPRHRYVKGGKLTVRGMKHCA